MHVDRAPPTISITVPHSRRPDYVGHAPSGWAVVEAKGRSQRREKLIDDIRSQKAGVRIDGATPWLSIGCVALLRARGCELDFIDPPSDGPIYSVPDADRKQWDWAFYQPLVELIESGDSREIALEQLDGRVVDLPAVDMQIGLASTLLDRFSSDQVAILGESDDIFDFVPTAKNDENGVIVLLGPSWEALEPE